MSANVEPAHMCKTSEKTVLWVPFLEETIWRECVSQREEEPRKRKNRAWKQVRVHWCISDSMALANDVPSNSGLCVKSGVTKLSHQRAATQRVHLAVNRNHRRRVRRWKSSPWSAPSQAQRKLRHFWAIQKNWWTSFGIGIDSYISTKLHIL